MINIIVGMSISAAVLILLAALIRKIFFHKLPKSAMTVIWLIPMAKLLIPYSPYTAAREITYLDGDVCVQTVRELSESVPTAVKLPLVIPEAITYIWLLGAVFTGASYIFRHISLIRRYSCSLPFGYDISELKSSFGIRRKVSVRVSEFADSPFTYGIIKPVIILPKAAAPGAEIHSILCHELSHIKRADVPFRILLAACTAVHWFDPFVWLMAELAVRDTELACDEKALSVGRISPEGYASALIGMAERRCLLQGAGFAGGSLKERVTEIMTSGRTRKNIPIGALAVTLSAAAALSLNICVDSSAEETGYLYEAVVISEAEYEGSAMYTVSEDVAYCEAVCTAEEISDSGTVYTVSVSDGELISIELSE